MEEMNHIQFEDELFGQGGLKIYTAEILNARYQWKDITDVVSK